MFDGMPAAPTGMPRAQAAAPMQAQGHATMFEGMPAAPRVAGDVMTSPLLDPMHDSRSTAPASHPTTTYARQNEAPEAEVRHFRIAPGTPPSTDSPKPIFDHSVAMASEYRYTDKEPKSWLSLVRNYIVGKAHEMEPLLKWAEHFQDTPIQLHQVEACRRSALIGEADPMRSNRELWSFLNLNVAGLHAREARRLFDGVQRLHGLEAWRRIVVPIEPKSAMRLTAMYDTVRNPPKAKSLLEYEARVEDWRQACREYLECGGNPLPEWERCLIAIKLLPKETPSSITIPLRKIMDFEDLVNQVKSEVKFQQEAGQLPGGGGAHLVVGREHEREIMGSADGSHDESGNVVLSIEEETQQALALLTEDEKQELLTKPLNQQLEALAVVKQLRFRPRPSAKAKAKPKARSGPKAPTYTASNRHQSPSTMCKLRGGPSDP